MFLQYRGIPYYSTSRLKQAHSIQCSRTLYSVIALTYRGVSYQINQLNQLSSPLPEMGLVYRGVAYR